MTSLRDSVDRIAADTGFSGAVRVERDGSVELEAAYGLADRAFGVPNTPATRFAVASVTKGFTACTVISLVADGVLSLRTTARSLLGDDLPLIADDVTVEHLLAHRSGIGDYFDEEAGGTLDDLCPTAARPGRDRGLRAGVGRACDEVRRRRAVLVLQQRLRGARAAGRARRRQTLPHADAAAGVRAGRA